PTSAPNIGPEQTNEAEIESTMFHRAFRPVNYGDTGTLERTPRLFRSSSAENRRVLNRLQ
ncbi:MAG: hypothetical protein C4334_14595, partial [Pyrinomonas sp.]